MSKVEKPDLISPAPVPRKGRRKPLDEMHATHRAIHDALRTHPDSTARQVIRMLKPKTEGHYTLNVYNDDAHVRNALGQLERAGHVFRSGTLDGVTAWRVGSSSIVDPSDAVVSAARELYRVYCLENQPREWQIHGQLAAWSALKKALEKLDGETKTEE